MRVIVLGAGVIGVTSAYYLARKGHEVAVVDRQPGAALEASFANGGQISANHATPWAAPGTPWKALKWLGQHDAPLLLHLRWDPALFAWLARFLANCTSSRLRVNVERAMRVALYSRRTIGALRAETGIQYDQLTRGILHIFRNERDYAEALPGVRLMNELGCVRRIVDRQECVQIEPSLTTVREALVGGVFSPDDETGDAHLFTRALASLAESLGVQFRFDTAIDGFEWTGSRITGVCTSAGVITGDAFVVALGSYTPLLLRPLRLRVPVYPGKGYSVTVPTSSHHRAPVVSIIDDEHKMVYARLGDRLRIAGTAEFAGYDATVSERRARSLLRKAWRIFPDGGHFDEAEFWAGLRPSTPDGVPVIGPTPYGNLFLNTGHGTLGWTMACGSGRLIADIVSGEATEIPLDGLTLARFG